MKMKPLLGAAVMVYDSALPTACTCTTRLDKQLTGWWSAASRAGGDLQSYVVAAVKLLESSPRFSTRSGTGSSPHSAYTPCYTSQ